MNALTMKALTVPRRSVRGRTSSQTNTQAGVLERAFAGVVLFLATGGLFPLLRLEAGVAVDDLEGDRVMQIAWLAVYAVTMVLLARRTKQTVRVLHGERWLGLLCGLAAVSILWSVAPDVTLRRAAALFGTTAFGVYLASRYTVRELLRVVSWVLGAAVVLSAAAAIFFPNQGISSDDGAWRGIFVHKNALGRAMALACLVLVFRLRHSGLASRVVTVGLLVLAGVTLLGSRSVAGLLTAAVVAISMPVLATFRLRSTLAVASALFALIAITSAAAWVSTSPELAVAVVGKDATLTGRTELWGLAADAMASRLWLGHGYSAFWLGWDGESGAIWRALPWHPPHAHNGILDLGLELGVVGVVLFAGGLVTAAWRSLVLIRRTASAYALWPIAYFVFMVMINLAESTILIRNSIFWMFYVVTCAWLVRQRDDSGGRPA